ncbi:molybdopterin-guanine dinucleotide biosynthesis protein A [Motilibacter peucedani]|uniref:Molybdopterin-guanine dinucleotide biosynthesis protein A n=1 Tax=Motilibacter peucedani TaxID=598650 RepID=A0A420XKH0_9ACTN|nr:molybdopterin-guanine dinucleotide biosynthesis protein A [Motilibacter peucedani]
MVLAGGASRRMGADKLGLEVGGRPILDRVLDAVAGAELTVAVGPERPTARPVTWCREEPAGGGPAAAVAAGVARCPSRTPLVAVLAGDLPFATAGALRLLAEELEGRPDVDAALALDDTGRQQTLFGVWRRTALQAACDRPDLEGLALHRLVSGIARTGVRVDADGPPAWADCDTPEQLDAARLRAGGGGDPRVQ